MKILAPDIEHAVESVDDIFGRDQFGAGLLSLFQQSEDPLVVALDEPWGSGKTVFAKRLARKAQTDDFRIIYFDAFKHDYDQDVFVALASEILVKFSKTKEQRALKAKAKDVAKIASRVALKGAVRGLTAGMIRMADFEDADEELAKEIGNEVEAELDKIIEARLSNSAAEQKAFDSFRLTLSAAAGADERKKPLIFIIDELDRCKPTYALALLEIIKHLFSVPNVHFLLICQLEQLSAATKKLYGSEIDAKLYLEKFIHFRATFPQFEKREAERVVKKFALQVLRAMPDDDEGGRLKDGFAEFVALVWRKDGYSLRRIERLCTLFGLCLAFTKKNFIRYPALLHVLCDLKLSSPELFARAKDGTLRYQDIKTRYGFGDDPESRNHDLDWYALNWRYYASTNEELEGVDTSGFRSHLFEFSVERDDVIRVMANKIVDRFEFPA